jgi:elongation factor Ts
MAEISATPVENIEKVKTLREKTGAGVIACRNALAETRGDVEAAVDRLRAAEASKASAKTDRVAAEGLVGLVVDGNRGALVELNAETDFAARTPAFREAASGLARLALDVHGDRNALLAARAPDGDGRVSDMLLRLTARTGEHVDLRRVACVSVRAGAIASYIHGGVAPGLGRIGVLVALQSGAPAAHLHGIGRGIAMHIAASAPLWVSRDAIPPEIVAEKRTALLEQAEQTRKPPAIVAKMVEGRMRKYFEEVVLGLQPFVLNPDQRVDEALREAATSAGSAMTIGAFVRFKVGEGLVKMAE